MSALAAPASAQIQPTRLLARARMLSRDTFALEFADTWILVVKVGDNAALAESVGFTDEEAPLPAAEPATVSQISRVSGIVRTPSVPPQGPLGAHAARRIVATTRTVSLPLRKRRAAERPFPNRVCVGRAGNCDVVLADRSISRLHGWFERTENGMAIADAGSKNGTHVNGQKVEEKYLMLLQPGDRVAFGDVEAIACPPAMWWELVQR